MKKRVLSAALSLCLLLTLLPTAALASDDTTNPGTLANLVHCIESCE